ncbi:MAG: hypothetical protein QNJ84_18495 [Alphaproteobacteria bacterium]|nr:hypothetical protein [Alphaproteobacteria bacterium]
MPVPPSADEQSGSDPATPPAIAAAIDAVRQAPGDSGAWSALGLIIAAQGGPAHLRATFGARQQQKGDGAAALFRALFSNELFRNAALRARLIPFADSIPPPDPLGSVLRFFAACGLLEDGDAERGAALFKQTAAEVAARPDDFAGAPHLQHAPDFAPAITGPAETARLADRPHAYPVPEMQWLTDAAADTGTDTGSESAPLIFAACDAVYLDRFGARFLEAAGPLGPVHLHIVNPTEDQLKALSGDHPTLGLSWERQAPDLSVSPYFASARFFRLESLLAHYRKPILMLDIDLEALHDPQAMLAAIAEGDIGYFAMPTLMPWLRRHAAAIYMADTDPALLFCRRLANLLGAKLAGARWFVDQLCLMSLLAFYRSAGDPLSVRALEDADGFAFAAYLTPAGDAKEKETLRTGAGL